MNIKKLVAAGALLAGATVVSAQSPFNAEYDFNLPVIAKVITVDASGNVYAAGTFDDNETVGPSLLPINGGNDVFILKLDQGGNILWAESFGGINDEDVSSIAIDPAGNIYIGGQFSDFVDFDPGSGDFGITSEDSSVDGYVLRLDMDGNFVSVGIVGGSGVDAINGVAVTSSSDVYLTGYFSEAADLNPTSGLFQVTPTGTDAFFVRLNNDGSFGWAQSAGNGQLVNGTNVTVDFTGTPIFAGSFSGSLDIDPGAGTKTLTATGNTASYMVKLNASTGAFTWGNAFGGDGADNYPTSMYANQQNEIIITGTLTGLGDFDPDAGQNLIISNGLEDIYIAKFHPSGSLLWAHAFGGLETDASASIFANATEVYVTGTFRGDVNFDPSFDSGGIRSSKGLSDIFILKLSGLGDFQWAADLGGASDESGLAISGDDSGNVYTTGFFFSTTNMDPTGCGLANLDPETAPGYFIMIGTEPADCIAIVSQPTDNEICPGDSGSLSVLATGSSITYNWMIQNDDGDFEDIFDTINLYDGTGTQNLTITGSSLDAEGIYQCRLSAPGQVDVFTKKVSFVVGPHAPAGNDVVNCGPGTVTLKVSGGPAGQYSWYMTPTGGPSLPGVHNDTYVTPFLNSTTSYYVGIDNESCSSPRTKITAYITACEPPPGLLWAKGWGGSGIDDIGNILVLHDGNLLVSGDFFTTVDFDSGTGTTNLTADGSDGFLMKITPDGDLLWVKQFTGAGSINPGAMVEDASGNLYVGGNVTGVNDIDPGSGNVSITSIPASRTDAFVAKFNSSGDLQWAKTMGGNDASNGDSFADIEGDASGVYVTGYFWSDFHFNGTLTGTTSLGGSDVFVLKMAPDGSMTWFDRIGNSFASGNLLTESADRLALNGDDLFLLANAAQGTTDLDPGTGTHNMNLSDPNAYVLILDTDGNFQKEFHYDSDDKGSSGSDVAIDSDGNIITTGNFTGTVDFDPSSDQDEMTSVGSLNAVNAFICKHASDGRLLWRRQYKVIGLNDVYGGHLLIDSNGDVFTSGMFQGSVDFDPGSLEFRMDGNSLFLNSYVVKLNSNGEFNWGISLARVKNVVSSAAGGTLVRNATGDMFMTGALQGSVDFDPQECIYEVDAVGGLDFYIQKLRFNVASICIDTQPQNITTCAGTLASFEVHAQGAPVITYQWQKKNISTSQFEDITDDSQYSGTASESLEIKTVGNLGAGTYRAIASATNAADRTSDEVTLALTGAGPTPPTTIGASSCDSNVELTLTALGGTDGQYRWYSVPTGGSDLGETSDTYVTPEISSTTTYYVAINDGSCESTRTAVSAIPNAGSTTPTGFDGFTCGPGPVTLKASGAGAGEFRWYIDDTGSPAIIGQVNDTFITPSLSTTTSYYVSIALADCESALTEVVATVNAAPTPPVSNGTSACVNSSVTLSTAVSDGETRWYDAATGGAVVQVGSTFVTPQLATTTTYYVTYFEDQCESARTPVVVTITNCATNQPPVIAAVNPSTTVGSTLVVDLGPLLSDPDNNLDLTTLKIITQPASGAAASIDATGRLSIDYSNTSFVGDDELVIEVCDLAGSCIQKTIVVKVDGDVKVYNAVSPNNDGKNDVFYVDHITTIASTKNNRVRIFNRWGEMVFDIENYDNANNVFSGKSNSGKDLPSGTYYYMIAFSDRKTETGYLSLKR